MDYIREELTRQERALWLLLGGREESDEREEEVPSERREEPFREEGRLRSGSAERGRKTGPGTALRKEGYRREPGAKQNGGERGTIPPAGELSEEAEVLPLFGREGEGPPLEIGRRGMAYGTLVSGGRADAGDLSRAIQLDARRYDGGFTIY